MTGASRSGASRSGASPASNVGRSRARWSKLGLVFGTVFWLSLGCSDSQVTKLTPSAATPAATGTVTTNRGDNGNTHLEIAVNYLAPPQKMAKDAAVYVVWATAHPGSQSQNIGALKVGDSRSGMLTTTTSLTDFDLRITPEALSTVAAPSGEAVMNAHIQLK